MDTLAYIAEGMIAGGVAVALGAPLWVGWVVGYAVYVAFSCASGLMSKRR